MSHHLDSPEAQRDPRLDISDVYLFRGETGTVFVMNCNPVSGTGGFHPEAMYEFKVDTNGDQVEDLTFRITFGGADPDGRQRVELRYLDGPAAGDRFAAGRLIAQGQTGEECSGAEGVRLWCGPAADPFFINGTVLTAVATALRAGTPVDLSGFDPDQAASVFAGTNVCGIVLEVPDEALGVEEIGFWGTTALATDAGGWRQIQRAAKPLVGFLMHPIDSELADAYNAGEPRDDVRDYGPRLVALVSGAVKAMGTCTDPASYAEHVRDNLLPDILRYKVGTAANFGFAAHNGRGFVERTPEVICTMVLNTAIPHGLTSDAAAGQPRHGFPYLPLPVR